MRKRYILPLLVLGGYWTYYNSSLKTSSIRNAVDREETDFKLTDGGDSAYVAKQFALFETQAQKPQNLKISATGSTAGESTSDTTQTDSEESSPKKSMFARADSALFPPKDPAEKTDKKPQEEPSRNAQADNLASTPATSEPAAKKPAFKAVSLGSADKKLQKKFVRMSGTDKQLQSKSVRLTKADKELKSVQVALTEADKEMQKSLQQIRAELEASQPDENTAFIIDIVAEQGSDKRYVFDVTKKEGNTLHFQFTEQGSENTEIGKPICVNVVYWDAKHPNKSGSAFSLSFYNKSCLVDSFKPELSSQIYITNNDKVTLKNTPTGVSVSTASVNLSQAVVLSKAPRVIETRPVTVSKTIQASHKDKKEAIQAPIEQNMRS